MIVFALEAVVPDPAKGRVYWDSLTKKITWYEIPRVGEHVNIGLADYPHDHEVERVSHNLPLGGNNPFVVVTIHITHEQLEELSEDGGWSRGFSYMFGTYQSHLGLQEDEGD